MYLSTSQGFGQAELPSAYGKPCLQDDVIGRLFTLPVDTLSKNLDAFVFRSPALRTWHKVWIKQQFVPAIVASWRTDKPIQTIVLVGDADEIGEPAPNYKLGKARAEAVGKELTKQIDLKSPGLSGKITIEVHSRGECWPVVRAEAGRAIATSVCSASGKRLPRPSRRRPRRRKGPNIHDIPGLTKQRKGRTEEIERRVRWLPVPHPTRRSGLAQREVASAPKWLPDPIVGGVVGGTMADYRVADAPGDGVKEDLKAMCKAMAQIKVK